MVDPECRNPDGALSPRQKVCRAGNASCSARSFPPTVDCDVCCAEPSFCRDCCCILCGSPVDFSLGSSCFIRCEARSLGGGAAGPVCGHVSHVRCTIASRLGGSVESVGVDVGYYCRRCDQRTDLVAHVYNMLRSCQVSGSSDGVEECLGLCLGLLQGAKWFGAMAWAAGIQSALRKLKEGRPLIEVWDLEDRCRTPIAVENTQLDSQEQKAELQKSFSTYEESEGKVKPDAEESCASPKKPKRKIQHVLEKKRIKTRHGSRNRYLVQMQDPPGSDSTRISEAKLKKIKADVSNDQIH
ncbi:protein OBERON 2 [Nymphaea colorata]|nr:protein OBERON 2 [Nymphaea colorata]